MKERHVSIWFLIGLQLTIFGVIIGGASVYDVFVPPATHTVLEDLHAGIYLGAIMFVLGLVYTVKFRPK